MSTTPPLHVPAAVWDRMVALRRDLHRHPELSDHEVRTAARLAELLADLGVASRPVGGTGLLADLPGRHGGPRVALRADTDALPVHEATGLPFASVHPGVMHACGHDGHAAMLLGAAELLLASPPPLPVRLLWQPAEELGTGARRLIADGALDGVGLIFGGHLDRQHDAGALVVTEGPVNASTDGFRVRVSGRSAHGARPHEGVDAVVVGSLLVTALQTIVSREVDPAHPSVVSVGSFHAGTAPNVIAGEAVLEGTVRSQHPAVREHLVRSIRRVAAAVGELHGATVQVEVSEGTPALVNLPGPTALARAAAEQVVGRSRVEALRVTNMGGEDFAFFLEHVPGCYIRYGGRAPGRESHPAHSPRFDFDERALDAGAAWLARVAHVAGAHLLAARP